MQGPPRILTCPHCGTKKNVISTISGRLMSQTTWSDGRIVSDMPLRPSFVQKCPNCGGFYLLSRQDPDCYAMNSQEWTPDELSYEQLKEAYSLLKKEKLDDHEHLNILQSIVWAFNDTYTRGDLREIPDDEMYYFIEVVTALLPLAHPLLRAELYREIGDYDKAYKELLGMSQLSDWCLEMKKTLEEHILAWDSKPYVTFQSKL